MQNFTPPQLGEKIATYKPSTLRYLVSILNTIQKFIGGLVWLIIALYFLKEQPISTNWVNWILGGSMILLDISIIVFLFIGEDSKVKRIFYPRSCSLYIVKGGVEIENVFIPFATNYDEGIQTFKLDGDNVLLSTNSIYKFIKLVGYGKYEDDIKFKIDLKFQFCKEELVSHLNSLIPLQ